MKNTRKFILKVFAIVIAIAMVAPLVYNAILSMQWLSKI